MPDPKSRLRLQRLISDTFRPDDLMGLFLYARDHCDGRAALSDIGHFVAHHHERDRGIITQSTREWFAVARFHMPRFGGEGGPRDLIGTAMPPATKDYFSFAVQRIGMHIVRRETGLLLREAHRILTGVAERLVANPDGSWALPDNLTRKELAVVNCACSFLVSKPAFADNVLFDDFTAMLKSNGLITRDELKAHGDELRPLVYLFAVAAMHNCVVQVGDGSTTKLTARSTGTDIQVDAVVPTPSPSAPNVHVSSPIFIANVDPALHCHLELRVQTSWDCEVELGSDRKLSPLR